MSSFLLTKVKIVCLLTIFLAWPLSATIIGQFDGKTLYGEGAMTPYWTASTCTGLCRPPIYYEVKSVWLAPNQNSSLNIEYSEGTTTNTEINLQQHRAGFFSFKVRACSSNGYCSAWTDSYLQGAPVGKWQLYWLLPKPIIVIE
jgi:hypothetical protein